MARYLCTLKRTTIEYVKAYVESESFALLEERAKDDNFHEIETVVSGVGIDLITWQEE